MFEKPIHGLRAVAALMVLVGHIAGGLAQNVWQSKEMIEIGLIIGHLGTFGVEIFFIISGLVIAHSLPRHTAYSFIARRFLRLYPLFLAVTALFVTGNYLLNWAPEKNAYELILQNILFLNIYTGEPSLSPNAWSIAYEFWFYIGAASLYWANRNHGLNRLLGVVTCMGGWAFFVGWEPRTLYFIAGYATGRLSPEPGGSSRPHWLLPPLLVFFLLSILGARATVPLPLIFRHGLEALTFLTAIVIFQIARNPNSTLGTTLSNRILMWIGTISYSLYLLHPYIYLAIRTGFEQQNLFTEHPIAANTIFFPAVIFVSLATARVCYGTLESYVYRRLIADDIYAPITNPRRLTNTKKKKKPSL